MDAYQKHLNRCKATAVLMEMKYEQRTIPESKNVILARQKILPFTLYRKHDYEVNWHHEVTSNLLDKFVNYEIKFLCISEPPQHGKTELAVRSLVPFLLGHNPDEKVIVFTHSDEKIRDEGRQIQRIMVSDEYQTLFPLVKLNIRNVVSDGFGNWIRTSNNFEIVGYGGYFLGKSLRAGSAGKTGTTIIIDDPFRNLEDAHSVVIRKKIIDAFIADVITRRSIINADKFRVLIIQTRWHEQDLIGYVLDKYTKYYNLRLPAICDEDKNEYDPREIGEALWSNKVPIEELNEIKNINPFLFSALYQQNPSTPGGQLFKRKDFKYFDENGTLNLYNTSGEIEKHLDMDSIKFCFSIVDLAVSLKETADYTVILTCYVTNDNDLLIYDVIRERMSGVDHLDRLKQVQFTYNPDVIGIERTQFQLSLVQQAAHAGLPVKELTPKGDKVARAIPASAKFESGKIYLRMGMPWLYDLEIELTQFPNGKHDDQVDCISYAVEYLLELLNLSHFNVRAF